MSYLGQPAKFGKIRQNHAAAKDVSTCMLTDTQQQWKNSEIEDVPQVYNLCLISHKGRRFCNQLTWPQNASKTKQPNEAKVWSQFGALFYLKMCPVLPSEPVKLYFCREHTASFGFHPTLSITIWLCTHSAVVNTYRNWFYVGLFFL